MRPNAWAKHSLLIENKREHRHILVFKMDCQLEPIGKQRLHHEPDLILRRVSRELRPNDEMIGCDPPGPMREHRIFLLVRGHDLPGEFNIDEKREIRDEEPPCRNRRVFSVEHHVRPQE